MAAITQSSPTTTTHPEFSKYIANGIVNGAWGAGVGYLAGHIFQVIQPMGGLVFGAVYQAADGLITPLADRFFGQSDVEVKANFIFRMFAKFCIAMLVTAQVGFDITFKASLIITGTMLGVEFITNLVIGLLILSCYEIIRRNNQ